MLNLLNHPTQGGGYMSQRVLVLLNTNNVVEGVFFDIKSRSEPIKDSVKIIIAVR